MDRKNIYYGIEPTKKLCWSNLLHFAYLADLYKNDFHITILIADIHAMLNTTNETPHINLYPTLTDAHIQKIKKLCDLVASTVTNSPDKFTADIVRGSELQLDKKYILDLYQLSSLISVDLLMKKATDNHVDTKLSDLIYVLMQILDKTLFEATDQLVKIEDKFICELSAQYIENLGYSPCKFHYIKLYNSLNIFLDDEKPTVQEKIENATWADCECFILTMIFLNPLIGHFMGIDNFDEWREKHRADIDGQNHAEIKKNICDCVCNINAYILSSSI